MTDPVVVPASQPASVEPVAVQQPVQPETPPAEPAKTPADPNAPTRRESKAFAALSRQRKAIEAREVAYRAHVAEIEKREAAAKEFESKKAAAKQDPFALLESAGLTYEDLTQRIVSGGKQTPEMAAKALEDKFEAFKREQEAKAKADREAQEKATLENEERIVSQWRGGVVDFVKQNAVTYELTTAFGAESEVARAIEEAHRQTGRLLQPKEAADLVEKHLETVLEKLLATAKAKAKAATPAPVAAPAKPSAPKTISVDMTAASRAAKPVPVTDDERMKRAMAAYYKAQGKAPPT
jgi:hypothetical protein